MFFFNHKRWYLKSDKPVLCKVSTVYRPPHAITSLMWVNQSACARKFTFIHGQRLYTAFTLPLHCLYTAFILPLHGRARITVNPYKTCKGIYSNFFKFPFEDRAAIISNQYMSFFTNSSGLTITGGNFTSISLSKQDAGRFYFHLKPYYCHY